MTPKEFFARMKSIELDRKRGDSNAANIHERADALMAEALEALGYRAGVEVYYGLPRDFT